MWRSVSRSGTSSARPRRRAGGGRMSVTCSRHRKAPRRSNPDQLRRAPSPTGFRPRVSCQLCTLSAISGLRRDEIWAWTSPLRFRRTSPRLCRPIMSVRSDLEHGSADPNCSMVRNRNCPAVGRISRSALQRRASEFDGTWDGADAQTIEPILSHGAVLQAHDEAGACWTDPWLARVQAAASAASSTTVQS